MTEECQSCHPTEDSFGSPLPVPVKACAPVMEVNCSRRDTYDSASQALTLFNSEFIAQQAERFSKRVEAEAAAGQRGAYAFRLAFSRPPSPYEADYLASFLASNSLTSLCHTLLAANEFVYID